MAGRIQAELRQKRPFATLEEQVFVSLQRTADALMRGFAGLLKPLGLSPTQYNVLRILRGAGPEGLPCGEVGERLITCDPDVTRLLDRLEARGLITRSRGRKDRRVVTTAITDRGIMLVETLDKPVRDLHRRLLGHLGAERLSQLDDLLDGAREKTL